MHRTAVASPVCVTTCTSTCRGCPLARAVAAKAPSNAAWKTSGPARSSAWTTAPQPSNPIGIRCLQRASPCPLYVATSVRRGSFSQPRTTFVERRPGFSVLADESHPGMVKGPAIMRRLDLRSTFRGWANSHEVPGINRDILCGWFRSLPRSGCTPEPRVSRVSRRHPGYTTAPHATGEPKTTTHTGVQRARNKPRCASAHA